MMVKVAKALKRAKKIAIFTHLNPDGDALGSSFAMKYVLESIGKQADVYLEQEMPEKFLYLGSDYIVVGPETTCTADTALVLDCADFQRLGTLEQMCKKIPTVVCVDHHYSGEAFGKFYYNDADSAATAQIVYHLSRKLTKNIPQKACIAMYTGISTDTGHFKFSSVTADTFFVASKLLESGINHRKITEILYDTVKYEKPIFIGKAAEQIEFFADGRVAMLKCPKAFLAEYGLSYDDVEELPNLPLKVEGVKIAVLVKDKDETSKRVSLRGRDILDLSRIAGAFGGGGHKNAAAFVIDEDVDATLEKLIQMIIENLGETNV
ncbi:MAG: bifunctional oligoribonuclease/PAP phosphatase NrnA [Clostridia bacterium]|nr:bifunctional oligoribonuclease/PAP phosphatase NrnA [Clostridia bacterium]